MKKKIPMTKSINIILLSLITLTGCSGTMNKLGINDGQLTKCPGTPNCVNSQESGKFSIHPIQFTGNSKQVKAKLTSTIGEFKNAKIVTTEDNYIRAEFTSSLFRFVDDIEFYFPTETNEKTTIQVRSASRTGRSDFGVNSKRVEQFRELLK